MKILVTGSRDWDDEFSISATLAGLWPDHDNRPTLIHGGAAGADNIARKWADIWFWHVEVYSADWVKHGRAAGPIRNQEMVDRKPDICLVFRRNKSRGATDCGERAEKAGIKTVWVDYEDLD